MRYNDQIMQGERNSFTKIERLFYMGCNDQIMQRGRKVFTNAFSSSLNSVNLKHFPGHGGRHT